MEIKDYLIRRGFLLEVTDEGISLSDNAEKSDNAFLDKLLREYHIGYLDPKGVIILEHPNNIDTLSRMFDPIERGTIGVGSCNQNRSWYAVSKRNYAAKIPVLWLEPNIALYIKALSACGIYTGGCCDGNHPGVNRLYIEFDGPIYQQFHKCIWTILINAIYDISWNENYNAIDLSKDRQKQYDLLYEAGKYIYEHRIQIQNIRKDASKWMNKKIIKRLTSKEICERFLYEAELSLIRNKNKLITE